MSAELNQRCRELVAELGLAAAESVRAVVPLSGGVSSDIARVELAGRSVCVKFALPKLKVAADWEAPVHRNRAEYAWLEVAAALAPESAVRLYGRSEALHGFAMEYLSGEDVYLWKATLLAGQDNRGEAQRVGELLGRIHAASAAADFDATPFQNRDDFHALRIEPYLVYTAGQYPELAAVLNVLADELYRADRVLVHGDVSPKNILFRGTTPIILDAECATLGDAGFDVAFCLNHLVLKAVHLPKSRRELLGSVIQFWQAYQAHINWEDAAQLEARICQLLPALMLARIDGKSPVEYLDAAAQQRVRALALPLIQQSPSTLRDFISHIAGHI